MVETHYHDSPDSEKDNAEAYENCVLSLYDGICIGCLAYDIKDKFVPLGYTKCIALEPNPDLRKIAAEPNPSIPQTEDTATFPGIQHCQPTGSLLTSRVNRMSHQKDPKQLYQIVHI